MLFKKGKVESIESFRLSISGMRSKDEFEVSCEGSDVKLRQFVGYHCSDEPRKPVSEAICDAESFIGLLNDCGVMGWDGFHGSHPRNVLDGEMFTFEALVNGGRRIYASGSANFPKGFWDLRNGLREILEGQDSARNR
ncbi:MAG: hypothetical protein J5674_01025 [Candidatus Methanomethylophilaceae archaeon]|nr:hypothetical protein [Candidatus Methanomethylophilaceae archaeon]